MRIDNINISNSWQRATRGNRLRMGAFLIIVGSLCCFCVIEVLRTAKSGSNLTGNETVKKCEKEAYNRSLAVKRGITMPTSASSSKTSSLPQYKFSSINAHHSHTASYSSSIREPQYSFRSANTGAVTVYSTSSATVKSIGGGGGNGGSIGEGSSIVGSIEGGSVGGSVSGASIGRNSSTSIMVEPTLARISSRELTASNLLAAQAQVIKDGSAERQGKAGIRTWGEHDPDPYTDPIGDGVWALLLLIAAYGAFNVYRRKQRV